MKYLILSTILFFSTLFAQEIMTNDDRGIQLRMSTLSWDTNWKRHTIDYDELLSGGPSRDGIPPIDNPKFVSVTTAQSWIKDQEPIIFIKINNQVKAYPIQILIWHEIVNDILANQEISVTFCPLCNSSIVFNRILDGKLYDFGTSGLLRHSDLVMYDRQTQSLWQQFTGEAIVGDVVGKILEILPSSMISFKDYYKKYPEGLVLSRDTGNKRAYGSNPYVGYDDINNSPFLYRGDIDGRLRPMERVVTLHDDNFDIAYPYSVLRKKELINDTFNNKDIVLFYTKGKVSALDKRDIASSKNIGSVTVYNRQVNGQSLIFTYDKDVGFIDVQTKSRWNIFGEAISGKLKGTHLQEIVHADHFWFSWVVFRPNTKVYR